MIFSMPAWREYCLERVETNTNEQKLRLERLIDSRNPENKMAWANLAADIKTLRFTDADGTAYVLEWREALHQVIGHLVFPPGAIKPMPSQKQKYKKVLNDAIALREAINDISPQNGFLVDLHMAGLNAVIAAAEAATKGNMPQPLMPGKNTEKNADRNWLALYIKERIIAVFFNNPHHEDIARLVNSALNDYSLTSDAVRFLKPRSRNHP